MPKEDVISHIDAYWTKNRKDFFTWEIGPIQSTVPGFCVCRVRPLHNDDPWVYVSVGASEIATGLDYAVEFLLLAPDEDAQHVETLSIVTYYHATTGVKLDVGRVIDIGRPWIEGSVCDRLLVSLPYPYGPMLEWFMQGSRQSIRFLWLLPISPTEAQFARIHGVEILEQRFDDAAINAIDPRRPTVA